MGMRACQTEMKETEIKRRRKEDALSAQTIRVSTWLIYSGKMEGEVGRAKIVIIIVSEWCHC